MARLENKVVAITGAARGQGRSHAVHMAAEGADIIAFDICSDIASTPNALATEADLDTTRHLVEQTGRRIVTAKVDVRDRGRLADALDEAVARLGRLDAIVANAGISAFGPTVPVQGFVDAFDVDFVGVVNTVSVGLPHLKPGASIVVIGSIAALASQVNRSDGLGLQGPGAAGYGLAKSMLCDYTKSLALVLGEQRIRVNAVHPTNVDTDMLHIDAIYRTFRPDLDNPTRSDAEVGFTFMHAMPVPYVDPADISHAVVYLASDESRYVTGQQLFVDAGAALKAGL
ncbi:mycofactocin-coupled SDR family oxidoreductase [Mycolicibacterium diernhoferi]|uniref:3-ketoacyl-ACP reductase n=1 Tax=Mycolicibacterium diernhoferi TaxID=1801 RepID=A0A1Q4HG68_9MYCO|nr:mycofactocin-coupled SDR family oxidoreductase [Mycolicibacterium diernhoferi]OJZ66422.1 3-ketoacyl-ACP reductase [Mycolicibacterium diernhoferi]OPE56376.1 3-ketoacyl-ACP reductase [Mycolicibacterium diernhoferi]PEG56297.1 SDR family mycofactocin-dependent oxidoreductase [Mycolicibacterium diernhoferi]QYL24595.1 mycofactocin-coupled SDR family oxidoreductase [Mycolicibacterium diernhoferi]